MPTSLADKVGGGTIVGVSGMAVGNMDVGRACCLVGGVVGLMVTVCAVQPVVKIKRRMRSASKVLLTFVCFMVIILLQL